LTSKHLNLQVLSLTPGLLPKVLY